MNNVLHIGAERGEIDFYHSIRCDNLAYVEPDKGCLVQLHKNAGNYFNKTPAIDRNIKTIQIIEKACSSTSNVLLEFYSNSGGQSSLHKPGPRTIEMINNKNFTKYSVTTVTLKDVHAEAFKNQHIDYLCIDTQGHEADILCSTEPIYLASNFTLIDVELMTDPNQYDINPNRWKNVVSHLHLANFTPIIHSHGFTESYLFVNNNYKNWIQSHVIPIASSVRDELMYKLCIESGVELNSKSYNEINAFASTGDHFFVPFSHIPGTIHASLINPFRLEFITRISNSMPSKANL